MEDVAADEGGEVEVREGEGEGELDHHDVGATGEGAREDEMGGDVSRT